MKHLAAAALLTATMLVARAAESNVLATVPLTFARGQAMASARVNEAGPFLLLLDTGFSMTMLRPDVAQKLGLKRVGEVTVEGIAGDEQAPTYEGALFDVGGTRYQARRIGAMPPTRRRRDGILGSGFFRQYVVKLDPAEKTLTLFSPTNFNYAGKGEIVPLRFRRSTTPVIDAAIRLTNGVVVRGSFEVDTGCDSGVCVASDFALTNNLIEVDATKSGTKLGVGGGAPTRSGHLPELQIGALSVTRPETEFFLEGSPAARGHAGHIGMEVFNRFRVYFDYSRQRMILEPLAAK
jgi:hypothetical protein